MATVIPSFQRRVGEQNIPNVRVQEGANPDQFGAGIGKGLQQLGNVLQVKQEQDDRNAVIGAKANSDMQLSDYLYNANTGVMNTKGQDALGLSNRFGKDYDELIKKNSENLNDRQKQVYNQYALSQKDNYLKSIASHETQQRQIYTETNAKTAISNAQNLAILNPNDQNLYNSAIDTIVKTRKSVYGNLGDDVVNKMVADDISGIRQEQVSSMISQGQGIAARDFLVAHKNEIDPKQYDSLFAGAESKAAVQESKAVADDVFSRYGVNDERAAMKYLKDAYGNNPGFDRFSSAVQARFVDERRFKNEEQKQNEENLLGSVWRANSLSEAQDIIENSGLPPSKKLYLLNQAKSKFKTLAGKPTPDQTYWHGYERNGLTKDIENMRLYEKRTQEGGEPTPEQQKSANISAARLNAYWQFSTGGAYNPNAKQKEVIPLDEYQLLKSKGFTDEQIASEYLTEGVEE